MSKYLKSMMMAILVSLWATAQAQCLPPQGPGPPRLWDGGRGCYVAQGTPAFGAVYNGVPQMVGQPYGVPQYYGGVPQQYYGGVPTSGLSPGAFWGGVLGATLGSLNTAHRPQAIIGGAVLGGFLGNAFSGGQRVIAQPVYQQPMYAPQPVVASAPVYTAPVQTAVIAQPYGVQQIGAVTMGMKTCYVPLSNGSYDKIVVQPSADCRAAIAGQSVSVASQAGSTAEVLPQKKLATYGNQPTVREGHTCSYVLNGEVVVDYFDKGKNPEGVELPSSGAGPQCREKLQAFKQKNNLS